MTAPADKSEPQSKSIGRGGKRAGAGRKPRDPALKAAEEQAVMLARASKYDPSLCDLVEKTMGQGFSLGAFAGTVGIARSTVNQWMAEYPEFSEACNRAKARRLVHWERAAMRVAQSGGGPGTAQIIQFGLKNMGAEDWSDKQTIEHTGDGGGPVKIAITPIPEGMFFNAAGDLVKDEQA